MESHADLSIKTFADAFRDSGQDSRWTGHWLVHKDGYVLLLRIYGDDSFARHEPGFQGCCAIGAIFADHSDWEPFCDDWKIACESPRRIDYFRTREMIGRSGQFNGFTTEEANDKFESLVSVIESSGEKLVLLDSIITWDIYDHVVHPAFKEFCKSPHFFGIMGVLMGALDVMGDLGGAKPTSLIFDQQDGIERPVHQAFDLVKQVLPADQANALRSITFADDKYEMPLQAADLLAWQVRRQYLQLPEDKGRVPPAYERFQDSAFKWQSIRWDEEKLRELFANVTEKFTTNGRLNLTVKRNKRLPSRGGA